MDINGRLKKREVIIKLPSKKIHIFEATPKCLPTPDVNWT